jgi:hypothetical protein
VSISPTFNLNVTDGIDTAVLNQTNSTLTLSSPTSVIYTVTNNSIPGVPGTVGFNTTTNPLQVTGQSGVSNSVGQWNLAGSEAANGPYTVTFGGANPAGVATPTIAQVTNPVGVTSVNVTGTGTDTVTLYTENGTVLGSIALVAGAGTITTNATVFPNTVLIATQSAGGVTFTSKAAVQAGFSPLNIASAGTLTAGTNVNVTVSTLPGLSESLAFIPGGEAAPAATASVNSAPLAGPTAFIVPATGQIVVVFTAGGGGTVANVDAINSANGTGGTTTGTDTYTN